MSAQSDEQSVEQSGEPLKIIGVAGGSCSGKTTFARLLAKRLGSKQAILIGQDSYYIDQSARFDKDGGSVNFDHPDSIDWDLLEENLSSLRNGRSIEIPKYDFVSHKRLQETVTVHAPKYVVLDGILIYVHSKIRQLIDHKIFIQANENIRFSRRLNRDVAERGRTKAGVRAQFYSQVKPMHDQFVEPTSVFSDLVLSGEVDFTFAIEDVLSVL